jgi:nitrogenase-stabilizing/protective protein
MSILDELRQLSSAEDFFEKLEVDYDPAVVRVARLHILRRMGEYLAGADLEGVSEAEMRAVCKERLGRAYADFVSSTPIEQRLFKVHRDAVKPKPEPQKPFVSLDSLISSDARAL